MTDNRIPIECPECGSDQFSKVNRLIEVVNLEYDPHNAQRIVIALPRSTGDYRDTARRVTCIDCHTEWESHEELEEDVSIARNEDAPLEDDG